LDTKKLKLASYKKSVQAGDVDKVAAYLILESYLKKNGYLQIKFLKSFGLV